LNFVFPSLGRFIRPAVCAAAFVCPGVVAIGQVAEGPSEAEKRLEWLNARMPPREASAPKATSPKAAETPRIGFRSSTQTIAPRTVEKPAATTPAPAEKRTAEARPVERAATKPEVAEASPAKTTATEGRLAKASPTPAAKTTPAPVAKVTAPAVVAEPTPARTHPAEAHVAKASPTPLPKATPALLAKLNTPIVAVNLEPGKSRAGETREISMVKPTTAPTLTAITSIKPAVSRIDGPATLVHPAGRGRYPWKTGIVTTVFWVGEPASGNNFTPNHSSSWDANWAQSYGGFDNPDPAARRNFLPVKFTPRQNPFYVALPYNDVSRGGTKPEARRVIPWFREEFEREGQSVCRDRWVAIRSRSGRTAYAQWSDCGPFRTDHWQYVFGTERPKPNLNGGAGLDVSPAVRDYLGLNSTDVTDWKFVDFAEVPSGPWARHGANNDFVLNGSRPEKNAASANERSTRVRLGEL
jgi:hypothetical protein